MVARATSEKTEVVVFLSDIHVPYHDHRALDSALDLIRVLRPHRVVQIGDLVDFHSISRWNTELERLENLQDELDEAVGVLRRIREAAPDAQFDLCMGNHDERLKRYVAEKGRALASLRSLDFGKLLDADAVGLRIHNGHGFLLRRNFLVKHGQLIRKGAGASAKAECLAADISGISGHTHRLATFRQSGYNARQWTECGTLSRLDAPYVTGPPDWQQGFAVGHFGKSFLIEEVQSVGGEMFYGGVGY